MPTNKIQKVSGTTSVHLGLGQSRPSVAGIIVDSTDNHLKFNPDGATTAVQVADSRGEPGAFSVLTGTTATLTTAAQSGTIYVINTTTSYVVNLPPPTQAGYVIQVIAKVAAGSGVGHSVAPGVGYQIVFKGASAVATNKAAINTQATAGIGDGLRLKADGTDTWYAEVVGTWSREG